MRWYLIATKGAMHLFHIDSDGVGTEINVLNKDGAKLWVVATPVKLLEGDKEAQAEAMTELGNIRYFLEFDLELPDLKHWILEGVLLKNKTRL